jgi:hypothetical protein
MKRLISLEAERHRQLSRIVWSGLSGGIGEEIVTSLDRDNGNFLYPGYRAAKISNFFRRRAGVCKAGQAWLQNG